MEVRFVIPEDIVRKVEYIPDKVLPDVLTEVFRAGFKSIIEQQTVKIRQEMPSVASLELLMAAVASLSQPTKLENSKPFRKEEQAKVALEVVPVIPQVEEDDEDLGDLLGMLK